MKKSVQLLFNGIIFLVIAVLYLSAANSGFHYMYDIDEQYHIQTAYQISIGLIPYRDFFVPYTTVFHYVLLPFVLFVGKNFVTLSVLRILMIIFFGIRIVLFALVVSKAFGKRIALLSVILTLCDPFTIFSGMQIRPDTLMLVFSSLGLLFWYVGISSRQHIKIFLAGFFLMLSSMVLLKSVPFTLVSFVLFFIYVLRSHSYDNILPYIAGHIVGFLLPFVPFIVYGVPGSMFTQAFRDVVLVLNALQFPAFVGDILNPVNFGLFGQVKKSVLWVYVWILIAIGISGVYTLFQKFLSKFPDVPNAPKVFLQMNLLFTLVLQWGFLFMSNSVFIQYYVPVMMYMTVFGSSALIDIFEKIRIKPIQIGCTVATGMLLFLLIGKTIQANEVRSTLRGQELITKLEKRWEIIPEDNAVFPSLLFRPPSHPLGANGYYELPKEIIDRYPSFDTIITEKNTPFVLYDHIKIFSPSVQEYIKNHYKPTLNDYQLYQKDEK